MANSDIGTSSENEYQVFLSFRGPDTFDGFTNFLFRSLTDVGVRVFRDNEELHVGEEIGGLLERVIDNSRIYIPVFSRNYASSQWCLRELARIVTNTFKSEGVKEILPIFFDVKPDDVNLKTPLYCHAILNLEHEMKLSAEQVDEWKNALMKVGAINGWEVKKYKGQDQLINLVVDEVVKKLRIKHRVVTKHLVGIDDQVVAVSQLLDVDSGGGRLVKIYGMGGIGKTTLAKVIFNQFSCQFGRCCFLDDVREKSSRPDGLVELQKRLLSEMGVHAGTRSIRDIHYGMEMIINALHNKKVLIVLDDVDNCKQVDKLVGKNALCSGSRILITTRNQDILHNFRPEYNILEYKMEEMSIDHALQLFSKHAFGGDSPSKDYSDISREIVFATGRLPLALQVVGSSLHNERQEIWEEQLEMLNKIHPHNIISVLRISYDALSFEQQQIFLDIACFFIGEDKTNAIYLWEDCGFLRNNEVWVLISRCLIQIKENNTFWMHDRLRDLGRYIIQEEMNYLHRCSRLWICEEILQMMRTYSMKRNVHGLDLDVSKSDHDVVIEREHVIESPQLAYLKLYGGTFTGDLSDCLTNLRWLSWSHPPRTSEATGINLKNVVILQFSNNDSINDSNLQSLIKMARKLKVLSLESCHNITRTPDFSGCLKLERLTLQNCSKLREIDCSIGKLKCLIDLRIDTCTNLKGLPKDIGDLRNLKYFFVQRSNVNKIPNFIRKFKLSKICLEFEPIKKI